MTSSERVAWEATLVIGAGILLLLCAWLFADRIADFLQGRPTP